MASRNDKDAANAKATEERTTERRIIAAAVAMDVGDASRDVADEDFLFHLYRGSELLQDNRIHEAKEELEQALTLQPRDPKGQDLLGVVYFRIGLYPRAIHIYEQLKEENPRDASLKLNLALCYLKTGQTQAARFELEDVVRMQPLHKRAWGYLGLAHERLGDLDRALSAFERGGHTVMMRRLSEKMGAGQRFTPVASPEAELRGAAAAAFEELDAGEISFSIAEPTATANAESWKAVEPGEPARKPRAIASNDGWTVPPSARAFSMRDEEEHATGAPPLAMVVPIPAPGAPSPGPRAVRSLVEVTRDALLVYPRGAGVVMHPSGLALVRTTVAANGADERAFAARLESIRSQTTTLTTEVMQRSTRGKSTGESFGGLGSPIVKVSGAGELALGARPSHSLVSFALSDETAFVREDFLLGFELGLEFENGKLALGDGESAPVVSLRGTGTVLLEVMEALLGVEVVEARPVLLRRELIIGWTGQVAPRALPLSESPSGQRGLITFTGVGLVLLAAR